jgi:hypothetical protein
MPALVFGGLALVLALFLLRTIANANPASLARHLKAFGGVAAMALGGLFVLTGRAVIGVPMLVMGFTLLGAGLDFSRRSRREAPAGSTVRTAFLHMQLDHRSGAISGSVVAGAFAGRRLDQLSVAELRQLVHEVDEESLALLEAYLERRRPGWRADRQADSDEGSRFDSTASGKMSEEQAYEILGLQPGAGADDIRRAHRTLMMKLHPDQGGSTYLAARVNEARETLLGRHG